MTTTTCYPPFRTVAAPPPATAAPAAAAAAATGGIQVQKDYSRPLHVDCSVEYELPNQAKPPPGGRNEPLLMIHPCYFRKIESQRRSPFVNNLPVHRQPSAAAAKRRVARAHHHQQHHPQQQQITQQMPQQAAPYPVQYQQQLQQQHQRQLWDHHPIAPIVPQTYCKRTDGCVTYSSSGSGDSGHWTDPDRSPERPEDKHILTGKYRQYLRAHRLHPYVSSAIPIASTFPQIQQVCYNV